MRKPLLTALFAGVLGYAIGCQVTFDDSKLYRCDADGDCGGGGYVCVDSKYCCKLDGNEADHGCDGRDNNCNGMVDEGAGSVEVCNGVDDDCDGQIDEGYDLIQDPRNCGACNKPCGPTEGCVNGVCIVRGETSCTDGIDNDGDSKIDCADTDCNALACGTGCECRAQLKAEAACDDGVDNDSDTKPDCADPDCAGAACAAHGCSCAAGAKKETDCRDGADNDQDGKADCADSDCAGEYCHAAPETFSCTAAGACSCNDGGTVTESGTAKCRDHLDNDCNGLTDCAETACDGVSCATDAGPGCVCTAGAPKETNCADRRDNDNDGTTDCGDSLPDGGGDCPIATACTFVNGGGMVRTGTCAADHTCK